jgi:hypothetical protein
MRGLRVRTCEHSCGSRSGILCFFDHWIRILDPGKVFSGSWILDSGSPTHTSWSLDFGLKKKHFNSWSVGTNFVLFLLRINFFFIFGKFMAKKGKTPFSLLLLDLLFRNKGLMMEKMIWNRHLGYVTRMVLR